MANEPPRQTSSMIEIDKEILKDSKVSTNVAQEFIVTTVDKAKLCLLDHQKMLIARESWIAPFGILITVVATLVTADFSRKLFGLGPATWQAIFILSALGSGTWLIIAVYRAFDAANRGGLDKLIDRLKAQGK